jgi:hypothetical protein
MSCSSPAENTCSLSTVYVPEILPAKILAPTAVISECRQYSCWKAGSSFSLPKRSNTPVHRTSDLIASIPSIMTACLIDVICWCRPCYIECGSSRIIDDLVDLLKHQRRGRKIGYSLNNPLESLRCNLCILNDRLLLVRSYSESFSAPISPIILDTILSSTREVR